MESTGAGADLPSLCPVVPSSVPVLPYVPQQGFCVLVRTYSGHYHFPPTFLALLMENSSPPKVFFVLTDRSSSAEEARRIVRAANEREGREVAVLLNVTATEAKREFPPLGTADDFGYAYTDAALRVLTTQHSQECRFLTVTNGDNIYSSGAFDRIHMEVVAGYQLISWSFVSHHRREPATGRRAQR